MKLGKMVSLILGLSLVLSPMLSSVCTGSEYKFGELTDLASKYGTDKGPGVHYFTEVYEHFFYPIKHKARKICEIGIAEGDSLKMFRDYFPNAVIYGIDINDASDLDSDTIKTFIADQSSRKLLKDFIDTYGYDFDIILDDGGHTMEQQQVSFGYLFKYLKRGGYYIIEDVHTSFDRNSFGAEKDKANATLSMINNYIRSGRIKSEYMTPAEEDYLTANIRYCNLFGRDNGRSITCIFRKKTEKEEAESKAKLSKLERKIKGSLIKGELANIVYERNVYTVKYTFVPTNSSDKDYNIVVENAFKILDAFRDSRIASLTIDGVIIEVLADTQKKSGIISKAVVSNQKIRSYYFDPTDKNTDIFSKLTFDRSYYEEP